MNDTFKHCVNSVFELYIYLLISRRYHYHTLPPSLPMEDHCKLRFDHIHTECKQKLLVKIFGT